VGTEERTEKDDSSSLIRENEGEGVEKLLGVGRLAVEGLGKLRKDPPLIKHISIACKSSYSYFRIPYFTFVHIAKRLNSNMSVIGYSKQYKAHEQLSRGTIMLVSGLPHWETRTRLQSELNESQHLYHFISFHFISFHSSAGERSLFSPK
jgi:hypothetical protein